MKTKEHFDLKPRVSPALGFDGATITEEGCR